MPIQEKSTTSQPSDEFLAVQVARGSTTAFETLYDRHAPSVLAIALKVIGERAAAEDILQETFWRMWKSADTFQSQRGNFTGWLFRIARNLAIDEYRRRGARPKVADAVDKDENPLDHMVDLDEDVVEQAQTNFKNKQIRDALKSLPGEQMQVLVLAYFYGLTRQEIADKTGEALGTIHTRARLGLQKLRVELDTNEFEG